MNQRTSERFLCLACASIFSREHASENCLKCPNCGWSLELKNYIQLLEKVSDAVDYGYRYRIAYEKQHQEQRRIIERYSLGECAEVLKWIGLAAITGIIGAVAWETAKAVFDRIKRQLGPKEQDEIERSCSRDNYDNFVLYIAEFYDDCPKVSDEIRAAIRQEMIVHALTKIAAPIVVQHLGKDKKIDKLDSPLENPMKALESAVRQVESGQIGKISLEELSGIWKKVSDQADPKVISPSKPSARRVSRGSSQKHKD